MSSALHYIQLLFKLRPLHTPVCKTILTNRKVSGKPVFKLQAVNRWEHSPLKGLIRKYFSTDNEHQFRHRKLVECHVNKSMEDGEAEEEELEDEFQNSLSPDRNGSNGNGNNRGNGNDNGNGGDYGGDEGQECDQDEYPEIEWWWWWKWWQACCKDQNGGTRSNLWPVDAAVQVVANEVMENIEPIVQAMVLEPIRQRVNMHGFILVLVFGALLVSCIQMAAGLAIVSMGASVACLAATALALLWRLWKRRGSQSQQNNEDNNAES